MSKQVTRQPSKQNRSTNKPSQSQSAKQTVNKSSDNLSTKPIADKQTDQSTKPTASKPFENQSTKQAANKQPANQSTKPIANKQSSNQTTKQARPSGKPLTRQEQKDERRREEQRRRQQAQRRAVRNKRILIGSAIVAVLIVASLSVYLIVNARAQSQNGQASQNQSTTETIFNASYPPVDNIYCDQLEQSTIHYHAHVSIYINGQPAQIPQNVGIASDQSCFYWLHTHDTSGVIHIESPKGDTFTLGNFFDIWSTQFLSSNYIYQLSSSDGWVVYVNGKIYHGDFHKIVLSRHELITLAYNSPKVKPDTIYNWGNL